MLEHVSEGRDAVLAALDAAIQPVRIFIRDDDAGWNDSRLFALLDCVLHVGVAIDLAVIPQAANDTLAHELNARMDDSPDRLGLHQHGFTHTNHQREGRKCEFGSERALDTQRIDLCAGRDRLCELFGGRLDSIFTPPWNRCSPGTPALLTALGYNALSRDRSAVPQTALPELSVDVDWCRLRRADPANATPIAAALARQISANSTVGLMLHHAQMDDSDLATLGSWLASWARHPRARWISMRGLLAGRVVADTVDDTAT